MHRLNVYPRTFAFVSGMVMVLMGILAFVPTLSVPPSQAGLPSLSLDAYYGLFLGVLPMNILSKLALIVLGTVGITASTEKYTSLPASIHYARWVFAIAGVLAVLGFFPQSQTLAGYWPLYGNAVWFHSLLAALGAYFGYALSIGRHSHRS